MLGKKTIFYEGKIRKLLQRRLVTICQQHLDNHHPVPHQAAPQHVCEEVRPQGGPAHRPRVPEGEGGLLEIPERFQVIDN